MEKGSPSVLHQPGGERRISVNISEMRFSKNKRDLLVTHSLGSCLGLAAYDPKAGVGALIHCLLPAVTNHEKVAVTNPFMYVNTGVPEMMRTLIRHGAAKRDIVLKAAGCAQMLNVQNKFDTGTYNRKMLLRILEKNNVELAAHDFGGTIPRTMYLHMDTGRVVIGSCGKRWEL